MAILVLDVAVFSLLPLEDAMVAKIKQGIHIVVNGQDNIGPPAAVATRRPPLGDELLPPEGRLAIAAVARFHRDRRPIDKLHNNPRIQEYLRPKAQVDSFYFYSLRFSVSYSIHADLALIAAAALECDLPCHLGKQGIILADPHIVAGMEMSAALTDQDAPRRHHRIRLRLYAEALGRTVASIARAADTLFMSK